MKFSYSDSVRQEFPDLVTGVLHLDGMTTTANVSVLVAHFCDVARERLADATEGALPEIRAWRRAFTRMGLKSTQYRCASEALLRRFRNEGSLPSINPLVDLCNAISMAFAIPIAAFDPVKIVGDLEVRRADGSEGYEPFAGGLEHPDVGEVIFADASARAHARRWVNRQSGYSAVRQGTIGALIIAEAMHDAAQEDTSRLMGALKRAVTETWPLATITEGPGR